MINDIIILCVLFDRLHRLSEMSLYFIILSNFLCKERSHLGWYFYIERFRGFDAINCRFWLFDLIQQSQAILTVCGNFFFITFLSFY